MRYLTLLVLAAASLSLPAQIDWEFQVPDPPNPPLWAPVAGAPVNAGETLRVTVDFSQLTTCEVVWSKVTIYGVYVSDWNGLRFTAPLPDPTNPHSTGPVYADVPTSNTPIAVGYVVEWRCANGTGGSRTQEVPVN